VTASETPARPETETPPETPPATDGSPGGDPRAVYAARRERHAAAEARWAARSRALSWARLTTVAVALFALLRVLLDAAAPPPWTWGLLAAAVVVFAVLARVHDRVIRQQRRRAELVSIQSDGLARLARRWTDLPPALPPPAESLDAEGHPPAVARDLSLFGPVSLARLLSTVRTPVGRATVGRWLLAPAPVEEARRRQPAVRELAARLDLRQELELAGRLALLERASRRQSPEADAEPFLAWAESEPWLLQRPALLWAARLLPLVTLGLAVAAVLGAVPVSLAALLAVVNLVLSWATREAVEERLQRVSAGAAELAAYAAALEVLAPPHGDAPRSESPLLAELAAELRAGDVSAATWMRRLAHRVEIADARHGSFHVFVQVLTLWDFHALSFLEHWQRAAGRRARRWLDALGEIEALAALATLAHDQPSWAFPTLADPGPGHLAATDLGHPLLADGVRVGNDVEIGPPGTFLLVTGSNMSGKSTLLRSLGLAVTLAQMGAPVCADALTLTPLALGTSVLVEDSLADGVSFFLAELLRLKQVVVGAEAARDEERSLLFLLDEVLRGTNSRERRLAVTAVLEHLLAEGAVGAISTHDLELGHVPALEAAARPVHFRETVRPAGGDGPPMTFDYRLRPGPAPTTNALALMAAVGLTPPAQ
jgi:hypothetical protein